MPVHSAGSLLSPQKRTIGPVDDCLVG
jgi:hypothetical protein